MNKVFENLSKKKVLRWYIVLLIILIPLVLYLILHDFKLFLCSDIYNCEIYLYAKPVVILVSLVLIFIAISKIIKWEWLRRLFYFFRPFYKNSNTEISKILKIVSIIIIIPGFIFSLFYYYQLLDSNDAFNGYNFFDQLSYILAYIGLILTVRVYFEIKEGHTESLDDFIKILTEILSLSDDDDDIVIYSPTLFLNEAHILTGKANYRNTAYRNKLPKFNKIKIVILDCKSFIDTISDEFNGNRVTVNQLKNADYNNFLVELQKDESSLNKFHQFSLKIEVPDNCGDKTNHYYRDFAYLLYNLKDKINPESEEYSFNGNGVNGDEYHGTFAISNFTKGIYYLGSFDVFDNGESFFRGTYFHNKHLSKEKLKTLIENIIK